MKLPVLTWRAKTRQHRQPGGAETFLDCFSKRPVTISIPEDKTASDHQRA